MSPFRGEEERLDDPCRKGECEGTSNAASSSSHDEEGLDPDREGEGTFGAATSSKRDEYRDEEETLDPDRGDELEGTFSAVRSSRRGEEGFDPDRWGGGEREE